MHQIHNFNHHLGSYPSMSEWTNEKQLSLEGFLSISPKHDSLILGCEENYGSAVALRNQGPLHAESPQISIMKYKRNLKGLQMTENFRTERQRRERFSTNCEILKSLIPKITKPDRATIIADTIDHIIELQSTINELRVQSEFKGNVSSKLNKTATHEEPMAETKRNKKFREFDIQKSLKSSWTQWESMETFVDVRIFTDEISIKLTWHKKNNSSNLLLIVSKFLDNIRYQLLHLSGGEVGKSHVFMFNSKIYGGSSLSADAISEKLIQALSLL